MNNSLLGIGAGLRAAVKSLAEDRPHFRVGSRRIVCPVCRHDKFDQRSMLMNTTGMTLLNLDWLNADACDLVFRRCTRMELFVEAPANE